MATAPFPARHRRRAGRAAAALALLGLAACGTRIEYRDPTIAEVAAGAAQGALQSAVLGSAMPVGAVTGAAGTFVEVRGPVYSQFPGRPSYRGSCSELRDCVFSGD